MKVKAMTVRYVPADRGISRINIGQISKYLNSHGILPKHEKVPWSAVTVGYILRNERYIGDALLQKKFTTDTFPYVKRRNNGERRMYYEKKNNKKAET